MQLVVIITHVTSAYQCPLLQLWLWLCCC